MKLFFEESELEGRQEGRLEIIQEMILDGKISLEDIAKYSRTSLDEIRRIAKDLKKL